MIKQIRKGKNGVLCIIFNKGNVLLIKRRNIFFIINPGIWAFLTGKIGKKEKYIDAAYREIYEETHIEKENLLLKKTLFKIRLFDVYKKYEWFNTIFIFYSDTKKIKLNFENVDYRWAKIDDILNNKNYTNIFCSEKRIKKIIKIFSKNNKKYKRNIIKKYKKNI